MKYFGTDGIRGEVDKEITAELSYKVGLAIGKIIMEDSLESKVLIGCDTRESADLLVSGICSGLVNLGVNCHIIGVVLTATISLLTKIQKYAFGIMITASHNKYDSNGIKIINGMGLKCSKLEEERIESYIDSLVLGTQNKGKIVDIKFKQNIYKKHLLKSNNIDLSNIKIVLDLANGSNYKIAPYVFEKLGAKIKCLSSKPNGRNINENCGTEHIENLVEYVKDKSFDFGFAFDGDADRLRVVLYDGSILDGDDLIYIFARYLKDIGELKNDQVVGTVMTNYGLELALNEIGVSLIRCDVGDKNVVETMMQKNIVLGGESSGHIALFKYNTTCDALFNALFFLKIILSSDDYNYNIKKIKKFDSIQEKLSVSCEFIEQFKNDMAIASKVNDFVKLLRSKNRIVVRPSGTEPVIRIYVEGKKRKSIEKELQLIKNYIIQLSNCELKK